MSELYTHREDDYTENDRYCFLMSQHMHQMTVENLHSKGEIAIELAARDLEIESLQAQLSDMERERDEAVENYRLAAKDFKEVNEAWNEAVNTPLHDHPDVKALVSGLKKAQRHRTGAVDEWKMWMPIDESDAFYEALSRIQTQERG